MLWWTPAIDRRGGLQRRAWTRLGGRLVPLYRYLRPAVGWLPRDRALDRADRRDRHGFGRDGETHAILVSGLPGEYQPVGPDHDGVQQRFRPCGPLADGPDRPPGGCEAR